MSGGMRRVKLVIIAHTHVIKYVRDGMNFGEKTFVVWYCMTAEITSNSTLIHMCIPIRKHIYTHTPYVDHMHIVFTLFRNFNKMNQILDFRKLVLVELGRITCAAAFIFTLY